MTRPDPRTDENGFALMVALVSLVAFTALATGGIWVSSTGFQSTDAFEKGSRAFWAADAALQEFLGTYGANLPNSHSYDFGDGEEATVTATLTRRDPDVYHVQSTGTVEVDGDVVATRTVGTMALVDMSIVPPPTSNMFSPNGIEKEGASGTISGYDQFDPNNPGQCPNGQVQDKNGVTVSDSAGYDQQGDLVPEGSPNDILEKDKQQMLDDLDLDWQGIVNEETVNPDVRVDPAGKSNYPDFDTVASDNWPVVYATGEDKTLSLNSGNSGHGLLIVRGNLTMNGSFNWDGMIMVGGQLTAGNGDQTVDGAMMSGLNLLLGEDIGDSADVLDGTKSFQYHSCMVDQARSSVSQLEIVPGTWYQG